MSEYSSTTIDINDDILNDIFQNGICDIIEDTTPTTENKKRTVVCGDLYVAGNLITHGSGTFKSFLEVESNRAIKKGSQFWNIYSDRKLKKNISNVTNNEIKKHIDVINKLKVKKFAYKNTEKMQLGLIANEYKKLDSKNVIKQNGFYTIDLNDIFFKLIIYVQELNKKIDSLEHKLKQNNKPVLNPRVYSRINRQRHKKIKFKTIAKSNMI